MKKNLTKISVIICGGILVFIVLCFSVYKIMTGKVSNDDTIKEFIVENGSNYYSIVEKLKNENLIKSEFFYKLYIKLNHPKSLQAGKYNLNEKMNLKEIISTLEEGSNYNPDAIRITFKEGINMRKIASIISDSTENSVDDVYNLIKDNEYLDKIIDKYWFITDDIKNSKIYYSIEGYLFPDTYEFRNKEVSVEEIFEVMLNEMGKKLEPYHQDIDKSNYSIHEILTLASIVELECGNSEDRALAAGVFYNRLKDHWSLGSDVTTFYAVKTDMGERELYQRELDDYNDYNTRNVNMAGKLPVSPICSPSYSSIKAAINPDIKNYYYFVGDKYGKTYFTSTYSEHSSLISRLKEEGLWYVR